MAQRSLTLRRVMQPLTLELRAREVPPRAGRADRDHARRSPTASAAPGLEVSIPRTTRAGASRRASSLPARELVSTFGHGRHACPAQRFSISAIRISVRRLLERFDVTPRFTGAAPRRRQIGAVARAARPCVVEYRARG